jgi:hypothetical protein
MKSPIELAAERLADHNVVLRTFLLRLLDPDDLGYAVTQEVREEARRIVNQPKESRT